MKNVLFLSVLTILSASFHSNAQTIAFSENFESATVPGHPAGWSETHIGSGRGWETHKGPTRRRLTDVRPHTTYAVVDDYKYFHNSPAKYTSPTFSLVGLTNPYLSFDCSFIKMSPLFGAPGEQAWLDFSTDGGATFTTIDTLPTTGGNWTRYYKSLTGITPTANCKMRICYADLPGLYGEGLCGVAIDDIIVYQPVATDFSLGWTLPESGTVESYVNVGDSVKFSGLVTNAGTTAASSFTINYKAGSGPVESQFFSTPCTGYGFTYYTAFAIPYRVTTTGPQTVKIWITVPGDANPANDTTTVIITGVTPGIPVKREFIEDLTGTWCGWCPRGIIYMDSLWKDDSNHVSIVSVHSQINNDPMANDNIATRSYDTFTMAKSSMGYPSAIVDRRRSTPVQYGFSDFESDKKLFGFAHMGVTKTITGSTLTAKATIKPVAPLTGDYRLELIVTEEDVCSTEPLYHQANAYSSYPDPMFGCGYNFNDSANIIPAGRMKFHFVARYSIPNRLVDKPNGVAGSLPATMLAGSYYSYTFAPITIPANWNPAKLRCIVALIDNNIESPNYGYVLNTANTTNPPLINPAAVTATQAPEQTFDLYPNPATEEVTVSYNLAEANYAAVAIYDIMGRNVAATPQRNELAGRQQQKINTSQLAPGVYTVSLTTGNNRVSKMLTITK